ncbi:MAG: hypothetical protein D6761_11635, partial [Candidatus Dadabacteria bacterium]
YNYKRYYQPGTGRYLSVDPKRDDADYGSAFNRPLEYIDPTGEAANLIAGGIGFIIGSSLDVAVQLYIATNFENKTLAQAYRDLDSSSALSSGGAAALSGIGGANIAGVAGITAIQTAILTGGLNGVIGTLADLFRKEISGQDVCLTGILSTFSTQAGLGILGSLASSGTSRIIGALKKLKADKAFERLALDEKLMVVNKVVVKVTSEQAGVAAAIAESLGQLAANAPMAIKQAAEGK